MLFMYDVVVDALEELIDPCSNFTMFCQHVNAAHLGTSTNHVTIVKKCVY